MEVASLLQFVLWVPLGLGVWEIDPLYLFAIPMARELYDLLPLFVVNRSGFMFSGEAVRVCFQLHLLYLASGLVPSILDGLDRARILIDTVSHGR